MFYLDVKRSLRYLPVFVSVANLLVSASLNISSYFFILSAGKPYGCGSRPCPA